MKAFPKNKLSEVLSALSKKMPLYVPVQEGDLSRYGFYRDEVELSMENNSSISPKELFFPSTEKIYKFTAYGIDGEYEEILPEKKPYILFGVRSCDMQAIVCMDDVFLTRGYVDESYNCRRESATIVTLGCTKPGPDCFCTSMGLNPKEHESGDLQLYDLGDHYGMLARTEKGEKVIEDIAATSLLVESTAVAADPEDCILQVDSAGIAEKLQGMFEHPLWDQLWRKCLTCGTCTYLCPTCHCFDISEKKKNQHCGVKIKCWDSCMFNEYALMAGGHNPRPSKKEKVRQRFMHKLRYFPERYGKYQCTGCGRCIAKCPVNLEITDVINQVREAKVDGR
ncbi:4Fe-4S dicluster domain-containing protein [Heliorestis convoluta]|uniref:4Fe-4S ferredoxin n=1 Tax=Heliorestis convoluta TaxID=356322 RepID=A0A5Q2N5E9_9FIRM|nr:4Fe-4S dicluster domain-containing protein [Heliorestis convoluta]QGG47805.1 4Fe-4S ferredoxin [Heliorestis convoluta]